LWLNSIHRDAEVISIFSVNLTCHDESMRDEVARLNELLREGGCCSTVLVRLALERVGGENEQLLRAVSGLCCGVRYDLLCGALTGAACMMNVLDPKNANERFVPALAEWFVEKMKEDYGGTSCADILGGSPLNKTTRCPAVIVATYLKVKEIMEEHGYDFE
jgi:hypothetical protein